MRFTFGRRVAVALTTACLASLVGAAGAVAVTGPPDTAAVKVGPSGTTITTTVDVRLGLGTGTGGGCSPCGAPGQLGLPLGDRLAGLQARLAATLRQTNVAAQRNAADAQAKVRVLQMRSRSLGRRAVRLALKLQAQAIAEARATADSVWLVADATGKTVAQSGGMTVSRVGTGAYKVMLDPSLAISARLGTGIDVSVAGPTGPKDGGFFLVATLG